MKRFYPSVFFLKLRWFMKRIGEIFFLLCFFSSVAPTATSAHPIDIDAVSQIESGNNLKEKGSKGEIGLFQISPIMLKHYNQWFHPAGCDKSCSSWITEEKLFKNPLMQRSIASWYMSWLYDRCRTVKDTLIAWNMGIDRWRQWRENKRNHKDNLLPKITQAYLKKYQKITGEKL